MVESTDEFTDVSTVISSPLPDAISGLSSRLLQFAKGNSSQVFYKILHLHMEHSHCDLSYVLISANCLDVILLHLI